MHKKPRVGTDINIDIDEISPGNWQRILKAASRIHWTTWKIAQEEGVDEKEIQEIHKECLSLSKRYCYCIHQTH